MCKAWYNPYMVNEIMDDQYGLARNKIHWIAIV
jgi:hypothetical protein